MFCDIVNKYGKIYEAERLEKERVKEVLKLVSITNRLDGICRAVITKYKNNNANSAETMFGQFQSPEWYRMKRAEHLLGIRQRKRWLPMVWGIKMDGDDIQKGLRNSRYCGLVYKGKAKPDILVMG